MAARWLLFAVLVGLPAPSLAATLLFSDPAFYDPVPGIMIANFTAFPVAENFPGPTDTPSGFHTDGLTYTVENTTTAVSVQGQWMATRAFSLDMPTLVLVSLVGHTDVTLPPMSETLIAIHGRLDGQDVVEFVDIATNFTPGPAVVPVAWNVSGALALGAGDHELSMLGVFDWIATELNQQLTVASVYGANAAPIPLPPALGLLLSGLVGTWCARRWPRRDERGKSPPR